MDYALVTGDAARIIRGHCLVQRSVRIVTGEARKPAAAIPETRGAMQVRRLMTNIPRVGPVCLMIEIAGLAMTGSAETIQLGWRQSLRILNRAGRAWLSDWLFDVRRAGSMA